MSLCQKNYQHKHLKFLFLCFFTNASTSRMLLSRKIFFMDFIYFIASPIQVRIFSFLIYFFHISIYINEYINNFKFNQYNFYFNLFHNKSCIPELDRLLPLYVNSPYLFLIFTVLFLSAPLLI